MTALRVRRAGFRMAPRRAAPPGAVVLAVLVMLVLVSGCSGGGSGDRDAARAGSRPALTSSRPGSATSTTQPPEDPAAGPLCATRAEWQRKANALDPQRINTPQGRRDAFQLALGALRAAAEVASPKIRPAIRRLIAAYEQVEPILARHEWDPAKVPQRERRGFDRLDLGLATEALNTYVRVNCGPGPGPANVIG